MLSDLISTCEPEKCQRKDLNPKNAAKSSLTAMMFAASCGVKCPRALTPLKKEPQEPQELSVKRTSVGFPHEIGAQVCGTL